MRGKSPPAVPNMSAWGSAPTDSCGYSSSSIFRSIPVRREERTRSSASSSSKTGSCKSSIQCTHGFARARKRRTYTPTGWNPAFPTTGKFGCFASPTNSSAGSGFSGEKRANSRRRLQNNSNFSDLLSRQPLRLPDVSKGKSLTNPSLRAIRNRKFQMSVVCVESNQPQPASNPQHALAPIKSQPKESNQPQPASNPQLEFSSRTRCRESTNPSLRAIRNCRSSWESRWEESNQPQPAAIRNCSRPGMPPPVESNQPQPASNPQLMGTGRVHRISSLTNPSLRAIRN